MSSSRDASRSETRQRLLEAAQAEFSERRYVDVSLDGIAQRAGFTKGAIYSNFRSKNDLLFAAVEDLATRRDLDFAELIDVTTTLDGLTDALVAGMASVVDGDRDLIGLLITLWAVSVHDPLTGERFLELARTHRTTLATAIQERLEAAGLGPGIDLPTLTSGLVGLGLASVFAMAVDPGSPEVRLHRDALGLLVDGARYRASADR